MITELSGFPSKLTVNTNGNVSTKARAQKIQEAKNFPHTKVSTETGMVIICTIVLLLNSSAQRRIEIPGMNNK